MITNASILRIDRVAGVAITGEPIYTTGPTIAPPLDCFLCGVTQNQRWELGATIKDSTNALYIDRVDLQALAIAPLANGDHVYAAIDTDAAALYVVLACTNNDLDLVSHFEHFVKLV